MDRFPVGAQRARAIVRCERVPAARELAQRIAEVVVRLGVLRVEPDRRFVPGDGPLEAPLLGPCDGKIVVRAGVVGSERDRPLVGVCRFASTAREQQRIAEFQRLFGRVRLGDRGRGLLGTQRLVARAIDSRKRSGGW